MSYVSSDIVAKYQNYLNPDSDIEFSLTNPFYISSDYQIDSVEVYMNSIVNMHSRNTSGLEVSVDLLLDGTYIQNEDFSFYHSGTELGFYATDLSSSTQAELLDTTIDHVDIQNVGDYALTCSSGGWGWVEVTYSLKPVKPNAPSLQIAVTEIGKSEQVKLLWSDNGLGTASSVTYYIYKNGR